MFLSGSAGDFREWAIAGTMTLLKMAQKAVEGRGGQVGVGWGCAHAWYVYLCAPIVCVHIGSVAF